LLDFRTSGLPDFCLPAFYSLSLRMVAGTRPATALTPLAFPLIVMTGLLDFRTSGLPDFRTSGLLDFWTSGLLDFWTSGLPDFWTSNILTF
ncbi:MAG: hypothetical protein SPL67_03540, partial [Prevotella sp.]|nr:hypothetical protein [Prevotella sp.]